MEALLVEAGKIPGAVTSAFAHSFVASCAPCLGAGVSACPSLSFVV